MTIYKISVWVAAISNSNKQYLNYNTSLYLLKELGLKIPIVINETPCSYDTRACSIHFIVAYQLHAYLRQRAEVCCVARRSFLDMLRLQMTVNV